MIPGEGLIFTQWYSLDEREMALLGLGPSGVAAKEEVLRGGLVCLR